MPRQPSGSGAPVCAPSPSSPLPPERYRALRARYNALLVTLYERTDLTVREIAMLAGRTDRAVGILVRALGCRPRNAKACRPGTDVGPRRDGPKPPPLKAPATRRLTAAFTGVARELAASAERRATSEAKQAVSRAERRASRAQLRVLAGAARSLRHVAAAMDDAATMQALTDEHQRTQRPEPAERRSRQETRHEMWLAQQSVLRAGEARMHEAHEARNLAARGKTAPRTPQSDSEADRRIDAVAERFGAGSRRAPPRIRRL